MKTPLICFFLAFALSSQAQKLKLKHRPAGALSGSAFASSISDTTLSLDAREEIILKEIKAGNIPQFNRKLVEINDTATIDGQIHSIRYFVAPDFLSIGSNDDYFYCPTRPALAQKIANLLNCSLPTRKMSDKIYQHAAVKMVPEPIPPTKAMITVPVFIRHSQLVNIQRKTFLNQFLLGSLVAGNKKDIAISNKIYTPDGKFHVVIYGWHKIDGKAIQPLYNGHNSDWADYSHGVRPIQNKVWVDGRKTTVEKILRSTQLNSLLSDEGAIERPFYPAL